MFGLTYVDARRSIGDHLEMRVGKRKEKEKSFRNDAVVSMQKLCKEGIKADDTRVGAKICPH